MRYDLLYNDIRKAWLCFWKRAEREETLQRGPSTLGSVWEKMCQIGQTIDSRGEYTLRSPTAVMMCAHNFRAEHMSGSSPSLWYHDSSLPGAKISEVLVQDLRILRFREHCGRHGYFETSWG
jgi:hypothetical protein